MQHIDEQLVFSASDLTGFVACRRLTWLGHEVAVHDRPRPATKEKRTASLAARKGNEHEHAYLERLKAEGLDVVEIPTRHGGGLAESVAETAAAIASGAEVVFQAAFHDGAWLGLADFLERTPDGAGYEAVDTKLARHVKPSHVIQLCLYSELLERMQGVKPDTIRIALGDGRTESLRLRDFDAYVRRLRARFEAGIGTLAEPYGIPVAHCSLCDWNEECSAIRVADDHLSLVAGLGRDQAVKLERAGIGTMRALALTPERPGGVRIGDETYERLQKQASAQVRTRESGEEVCELLPPEEGRGFALLPEPCPSDVFFDMEGDPYYGAEGLEYLFGAEYSDGEYWTFRAFWGCDRTEERLAFERFVDWVTERWEGDPDLHVHHYAHYEPSALKRLAQQHGTRELEVDELLRHGVFVDLYAVVRHAVRVGRPSYSIKEMEALYRDHARDTAVAEGGESIEVFEDWLETGDQGLLDSIEEYNADDCASTRELRDWLLERRAEVESPDPYEAPDPDEPGEDRRTLDEDTAALAVRLLAGGTDPGRELLANLLHYHERERRTVWWRFFDLCEKDHEELLEDLDAISGLEPIPDTFEEVGNDSTAQWFSFPAQEFKFGPDAVKDPATRANTGTVLEIDPAARRLRLKRGPTLAGAPLPRAVFPFPYFQDKGHRRALRELAQAVIDHGLAADGPLAASRRLLLGGAPYVTGTRRGDPLHDGELKLEDMQRTVARLDGSPLIVQGPPGSGKTHDGARVIVALLDAGKRVGITSNSHRAIAELLREVDRASLEADVEVRSRQKITVPENAYVSTKQPDAFATTKAAPGCDDPARELNLIAGTSWLFVREALHAAPLDYLFVDEAGQIALANAAAVSGAARNVVFLGDPQQLAQVSQATHPDGAGCSVLEHLLDGEETVPPERGLFLPRSWRMHPSICAYVSELAYEERLLPARGMEHRRLDVDGALEVGLRHLPVEHEGNRQGSIEEADVIAATIERLLTGGTVTNEKQEQRPLTPGDILVVAAYNHQVGCLRERLGDRIAVGTVDKFQGQQAPVVFYSLATSTPEDAPRGIDFVFNRNRLNVAVSRAQCLAVVVGNPALLDAECRTVDQMRHVNGACRFVEVATEW